jgi:hypothetical protein
VKKQFFLLVSLVLLTACGSGATVDSVEVNVLTVIYADRQEQFTTDDLQTLGQVEATFKEITYYGVVLSNLLQAAGIDPESLRAVKVTAVDGYRINYEPELFLLPDTLVSYARVDGALAADELPFRMVLPAAEGKLNVRMVTEIEAIP